MGKEPGKQIEIGRRLGDVNDGENYINTGRGKHPSPPKTCAEHVRCIANGNVLISEGGYINDNRTTVGFRAVCQVGSHYAQSERHIMKPHVGLTVREHSPGGDSS